MNTLAWPICRYPFGSGGNRVNTLPPVTFKWLSSFSFVLWVRHMVPSLKNISVWTWDIHPNQMRNMKIRHKSNGKTSFSENITLKFYWTFTKENVVNGKLKNSRWRLQAETCLFVKWRQFNWFLSNFQYRVINPLNIVNETTKARCHEGQRNYKV